MTTFGSQTEWPTHFPWPFTAHTYHYQANVEPAPAERTTAAGSWGSAVLVADERYETEIAERNRVLAHDPGRYAEAAHMRPASWEVLDYLLGELAATYPEWASYERHGDRRRWRNARLGAEAEFVHGDDDSLPEPPLLWVSRQVQEDVALMDQREDDLFIDAGVVTFASNWSFDFDAGMTFLEAHGPLPRNYADGSMPRARKFIMRLEAGRPYRRTNWTSTYNGVLDVSLEEYDAWGIARKDVEGRDLGSELGLRVEVQHLVRLPESDAVAFLIHTHMVTMNQIALVPGWGGQFADILETIPPEMLSYKNFAKIAHRLVPWLREHDAAAAAARRPGARRVRPARSSA